MCDEYRNAPDILRSRPVAPSHHRNVGKTPGIICQKWVVDEIRGVGDRTGDVGTTPKLYLEQQLDGVVDVAGQIDHVGVEGDQVGADAGQAPHAGGGDRAMPKEQFEVLGSGVSATLDDFRTLRVHSAGRTRRFGGALPRQDKGHAAELAAFLTAVRSGSPSPVDPELAAHVTRVTFAAVESARSGLPVEL